MSLFTLHLLYFNASPFTCISTLFVVLFFTLLLASISLKEYLIGTNFGGEFNMENDRKKVNGGESFDQICQIFFFSPKVVPLRYVETMGNHVNTNNAYLWYQYHRLCYNPSKMTNACIHHQQMNGGAPEVVQPWWKQTLWWRARWISLSRANSQWWNVSSFLCVVYVISLFLLLLISYFFLIFYYLVKLKQKYKTVKILWYSTMTDLNNTMYFWFWPVSGVC